MRLHHALVAAGLLLTGCASYSEQEQAGADLAAVRAITMAGPATTWEEMDVHPQLIARACSVDTLVNRNGDVVGYCTGGQNCRTMDWRPVEAACNSGQPRIAARPPASRPAEPATLSPGLARSPTTPPLPRSAMRVSF
jgi:hypothetical protein